MEAIETSSSAMGGGQASTVVLPVLAVCRSMQHAEATTVCAASGRSGVTGVSEMPCFSAYSVASIGQAAMQTGLDGRDDD